MMMRPFALLQTLFPALFIAQFSTQLLYFRLILCQFLLHIWLLIALVITILWIAVLVPLIITILLVSILTLIALVMLQQVLCYKASEPCRGSNQQRMAKDLL